MAGRDDSIRPVRAVGLTPLKPERPPREARAAEEPDESRKAEARGEGRYDSYRVVLDPETLRAVAQVRDPRTGEVIFTVPPGVELSDTAKQRLGDDGGEPGGGGDGPDGKDSP